MVRLVTIIAKLGSPIRGLPDHSPRRYGQVSGVNLDRWVIAPRSSLIGTGNEVACYFWETDRIYHQVAKMVYQSFCYQFVIFRLSGSPVESAITDLSFAVIPGQDELRWISWRGHGIQSQRSKITSIQYQHDHKDPILSGSRYRVTAGDLFQKETVVGSVLVLDGALFGMMIDQTEEEGYLVHWDAIIAGIRVASGYRAARNLRLEDPLCPRVLSGVILAKGAIVSVATQGPIPQRLRPGDLIVGIDQCPTGWDESLDARQLLVMRGGRTWTLSEYLALVERSEPLEDAVLPHLLWINRNGTLLTIPHLSEPIVARIPSSGILPFSREMIIHTISIATLFLDQSPPRSGILVIAQLSIDLINQGRPEIRSVLADYRTDPRVSWILIECTDLVLAEQYYLPSLANNYPPPYLMGIGKDSVDQIATIDLSFVGHVSIRLFHDNTWKLVRVPCLDW